eukprot:2887984-Amphidinium_carterae.1
MACWQRQSLEAWMLERKKSFQGMRLCDGRVESRDGAASSEYHAVGAKAGTASAKCSSDMRRDAHARRGSQKARWQKGILTTEHRRS